MALHIPKFWKVQRNSRRFQEILSVLAKYQFADWIGESYPELVKDVFRSAEGEDLRSLEWEPRVRMALAELGTTFIKLGQMLSTRADIVGVDLARELEKLQVDAPADSMKQVRATVEGELDDVLEQAFVGFEEEPLASASIAQVHAARLPDGQQVIVKVQHAGIEDTIEKDLEILTFLAGIAERHSEELRSYRPTDTVEEFRRNLYNELDFRREARNLTEFRRDFADNEEVRFPMPYTQLSGRRVLTMERLRGTMLSNQEALEALEVDTAALVRKGAELYLEMIFDNGFFHADPHPGNLMVLPDNVIGILDCRSAGRLESSTTEDLETIFLSVVRGDAERLQDALLRFGDPPFDLDKSRLRHDLRTYITEYQNQSLETFDAAQALLDLLEIIREHHIMLRPGIALLLKTLIELDGTSQSLDRDFSLAELIQPYYERAAWQRFLPANILERLRHSLRDWEEFLGAVPRSLKGILHNLRDGDFEVILRHTQLDTTVNRLVQGILTASLVLASALLLAQRVPPLLWDLSLFGLIGTAGAALLGWNVLRAIRRSGGLRGRHR